MAQRLAADEGQDALASPCSTQSDLIGGCMMSNQDLLSMCSGSENRKQDQQDEPRGLTGLTMMVGQTRLNVEPAPPVDCCDEVSMTNTFLTFFKQSLIPIYHPSVSPQFHT